MDIVMVAFQILTILILLLLYTSFWNFYFSLLPDRRAKLLLKKKRYLESLLDKTDQQLDNLQQMVDNIEFAQIEMKVVEGLKTGNKCLEEMHKIMSLEDVEQIMAETQDAIEYQRVKGHHSHMLHIIAIFLSCLGN